MTETRKLYRSNTDRKIAGICGGLGEYINIDPTVMRIMFVAGFFLTGSLVFWLYLVLWIVIPESPKVF
jgi:phage shock protein PspC (stress-responsive transcriptional regulator)